MSKLRQTMVVFLDELGSCCGCHRMPERSFFYKGHPFPVCARCTGVCIGQVCAILAGFFLTVPLWLSVFFLMIMGIDWGMQESGIRMSTNRRRLITGISGGFGLFSIYVWTAKKLINKCRNRA